ncbi:MAG: helix-turn-helix domain-containing protein [Pseudomonadota bacterium]|nr:helix-turn-helix domain-containing protein [Pseudomonadota bacterium]
MVRNLVYVVSNDTDFSNRAKTWGEQNGASVKTYTPDQWEGCFVDPANKGKPGFASPALASGTGGKVIPFPGTEAGAGSGAGAGVHRMNDLEAKAIENAISVYNGNLTEAAKALGIGRATLYRKVKLYNIDPSKARRKKMAA